MYIQKQCNIFGVMFTVPLFACGDTVLLPPYYPQLELIGEFGHNDTLLILVEHSPDNRSWQFSHHVDIFKTLL